MNICFYKAISADDIAKCLYIRRKIFIEGQNVPEKDDLDGLDDKSDLYLLSLGAEIIGTARVRYIEGKAKIERVAILEQYQGKG